MTAAEHALAAPSRRRLLALLREADGTLASVPELTAATGLSTATVRHHLAVLGKAGLVTSAPSQGPGRRRGRPRLRYAATESGGEDRCEVYRDLADALAEAVAKTAAGDRAGARSAGREWGRRLAAGGAPTPAAERVFALTARLGFRPHREPGDTRLLLLHCPYGWLVHTHPDVVCAVHEGVLEGLLESTDTTAELRPSIGPGPCAALLRPRTTAPPTTSPTTRATEGTPCSE
ncbi:ArsR family transcriptional regulator [Streptomyces sp. NPDC098789]|uniref:ArsR family transcriptional regulator n=1 Tax=Streptomyces sp. NPDC098789 TaxID=3366098 RepID=UPI0037F5A0D1